MTGPNSYASLITLVIILVPYIFADVTTVYYVSTKTSIIVLIFVVLLQMVSIICMIMAAVMDPGYIPRRSFIKVIKCDRSELSLEEQAIPFFNQYIYSKAHLIKLKYWYTCEIFRPPRTSHCAICDAWIERIDHHCPWLGTCIGKRNYKYFFIFINLLSILQILGIILSIIEIIIRVDEKVSEGNSTSKAIRESLRESPFPMIVIGVVIITALFVVILWIYHHRLACLNITTNEEIKGSYSKTNAINPYK